MSKPRSSSFSKTTSKPQADETKKEIERQHALLLANLDRKQLRGNVTMEANRHSKQTANLTQNQRRERYEITSQRKELLHDLRKVRSSYTGHYDDSKSPFENIQQALKTKCQTPAKSSRLTAPGVNNFPMRRCVSANEIPRPATSLCVYARPATSNSNRSPLNSRTATTRPKTAAVSGASDGKPKKGASTDRSSKKEKS